MIEFLLDEKVVLTDPGVSGEDIFTAAMDRFCSLDRIGETPVRWHNGEMKLVKGWTHHVRKNDVAAQTRL